MFLMIALDKAYRARMSMEKLGQIIGVSRITVCHYCKRLEQAGLLERFPAKPIRNEDGSFYQPCNTYKVRRDRRQHTASSGSPDVRAPVSIDKLLASFDEVYYTTMLDLMDRIGMKDAAFEREWEKKRKNDEHTMDAAGAES